MRIQVFCFILLLTLSFLNCSKNYQGDLSVFPLSDLWLFTTGDSSLWALPDYDDSDWQTVNISELDSSVNLAKNRTCWFRKHFVLPGHFVEKVLYLSLGKLDKGTTVYLNGQELQRETLVPVFSKGIITEDDLLEIDHLSLHYGKVNVLAIRISESSEFGILFREKPGIYTRLSYLQERGFALERCTYSIERDVRALLEDFACNCQQRDSVALLSYLSPEFAANTSKSRAFLKSLLDRTSDELALEIEIYQPEFFLCRKDSSVIVVGDWIFHFLREKHRMGFGWRLRKYPEGWKIENGHLAF